MHIKAKDCNFDPKTKTFTLNISDTVSGQTPPVFSVLYPRHGGTFSESDTGVFLYYETVSAEPVKEESDLAVLTSNISHTIDICRFFLGNTITTSKDGVNRWELFPTADDMKNFPYLRGTKLVIRDI